MITSDIQELFDGVLGDEQAAELFHALSVSPERRADFGRHVALQGAMQADRFDNRLTSDEDMAIWGTIAGLGVAGTTTATSSAAAWAPKVVMFVLAGVVGYILGTTSFGDIFSGGSSSTAAGGAADKRLAPFVVVPIPAAQPSAPTAGPAAATPISAATASRAPKLFTSADGGTRPSATRNGARDLNDNDGRSTPADGTNRPIDPANGTQQSDGNALNNGTAPSAPTETSPKANGSANTNAPATPPPSEDAKAKNTNDAAASIPPMGIDPQQLLANSSNGNALPLEDDAPVSALTSDGLELGYGHSVGFLREGTAASGLIYSNLHVDVSYRMAGGSVGVGTRLGLGNFQMLAPPPESTTGDVSPVLNAQQLFLMEAFMNYRLVLGTKVALSLEGSIGSNFGNLMQTGGGAGLVYFISDRIGIQGGLGVSRYWYNVDEADLKSRLTTEDASVKLDRFRSRGNGTNFAGNLGAFFHF